MLARTVVTAAMLAAAAGASAQMGTSFTYQGRLTDNGQPAEGAYDLFFRLWPGENAVFPVGAAVELDNVQVTDGLFTVALDFGGQFTGDERWLSISVRPGAGGSYTPLTPRQRVTATPYALSAASLSVPVYDTGATDPGQFTLNPLLHLNQTGTAAAIVGQSSGPGAALHALQSGTGPAIFGQTSGSEAAVVAKTTHPGGTALRIDGGPIRVSGLHQPVMTVVSVQSNTSNGVLTLDHPLMNGDGDAIILVTPRKLRPSSGFPTSIRSPCSCSTTHRSNGGRSGGSGALPFLNTARTTCL